MTSTAELQPDRLKRDSGSVGPVERLSRSRLLLPVAALVAGLLAILVESSAGMGHVQTGIWLRALLGPRVQPAGVEVLNAVFRKLGHLAGYGFLGVVAERVIRTVTKHDRRTLRCEAMDFRSAFLGVLFACCVGICDEVHQSFLATRHATVTDVVLDTFGAALFVGLAAHFRSRSLNRGQSRFALASPAAAGAAAYS